MRARVPVLIALLAVACFSDGERSKTLVGDAATGSAADMAAANPTPAPPAVAPAPEEQHARREIAMRREMAVSVASVAATEPVQMGAQPADLLQQSMIVRTGTATIRVDSLELGMARVRAVASRVSGYVGNTTVEATASAAPTATLELRVPSARFDEAIAGLESIGITEGVQVSAEDVGEQYVDLEARLANARRLEARLIELLATRTGRLSDVLQVEEKLSHIRGEIERLEGRMRWLRSRASVSTIAVTVHEPLPVVGPSGTWAELGEAARRAWRNFVSLVAATIAVSGILVPLGGIILLGWVGWRRRARLLPHQPA